MVVPSLVYILEAALARPSCSVHSVAAKNTDIGTEQLIELGIIRQSALFLEF